jgi:hypothetical protein
MIELQNNWISLAAIYTRMCGQILEHSVNVIFYDNSFSDARFCHIVRFVFFVPFLVALVPAFFASIKQNAFSFVLPVEV